MSYNLFFWGKNPWVLTVVCTCQPATSLNTFELGQLTSLLEYHPFFFAPCSCCIANPILKHWLKKVRLRLEISDCTYLGFFLRLILWEFVLICSMYWLPIFHFFIILLKALIIGALLHLKQLFEVVFCYYSVENLKESLQSEDFALLK